MIVNSINKKYQKLAYLNNGAIGNVIDVNFATGGKCTNFTIGFEILEVQKDKGCAFGAFFKDEHGYDGFAFYPRCNAEGSMGEDHPGGMSIHAAGKIFPEIKFNTYYRYVANFSEAGGVNSDGTFFLYDIFGNKIVNSWGNATATFFNGISCYAFAKNLGGTIEDPCLMNLYECSVAIDGVVVKNLIPVKRLSDNICGLYDTVSKEFYSSFDAAAAAEFNGPETNEFITEEYELYREATLIEKIEYNIETKRLLKEALVAKGVAIADEDSYREYRNKIITFIDSLQASQSSLTNELKRANTETSMAEADHTFVSDELDEAFIIANQINGEEV